MMFIIIVIIIIIIKCHDICILEAWILYFSGYSAFMFCSS